MFTRSCHEDLILTRKSHNCSGIAFTHGGTAGGSKLIEQTLPCSQYSKSKDMVRQTHEGTFWKGNEIFLKSVPGISFLTNKRYLSGGVGIGVFVRGVCPVDLEQHKERRTNHI